MRANCVALAVAMAFPFCTPPALAQATGSAPTKELGTVTVTGGRGPPTSLPTQIPATLEGTTLAQIEQAINATDSEDALRHFPSLLVRKRYIGDYNHAVLGPFAPGHALRVAPAAHGLVTGVGVGVARFFVCYQVVEGGQRVQAGQHVHHLAHGHLQRGATPLQSLGQVVQAFLHKVVVLQGGVGLGPQAGLNHVQTQHRALGGSVVQRGVVVHAQVAFEPDDGVAHALLCPAPL